MRDILFIGSILASVTHDMQNVMAIIKESGALTDDILQLNGPPHLKHGDKLEVAQRNIQEQVRRGRDLMLMLNGFAHAAADHPQCSDLGRFARQIAVLSARMARLKECRLETRLDAPPLMVRGNALMLMQSIYLGLAAVLAVCAPHDAVTLALDAEENSGIIRLGAEHSRAVPDTADVAPLMTELGASLAAGPGELALLYQRAPAGAAA